MSAASLSKMIVRAETRVLSSTAPKCLPLGAAAFFGMPNSESESEFTASTFLALGALLGLGGTSSFAVRS